MFKELSKIVSEWLHDDVGMGHDLARFVEFAILAGALAILCWIVWFITRRIALMFVHQAAARTKTTWDDALVEKKFFSTLSLIIPALIIDATAPTLLQHFPDITPFLLKVTDVYIAFVITRVVIKFFEVVQAYLEGKEHLKDKPIASYFQLVGIIAYIIFGVLALSILTGQSPVYFLSAMGAMTAVLLLVFKDTIMGFVSSIQLAANDMVRIGDWVTMPQYGADGDVIEITLATVKVRNFDRTITTIPTYSFISDSFKNWRGMTESDGRRIKRAINIKMATVNLLSDDDINRYKNYDLIKEYLDLRQEEIKNYNAEFNIDKKKSIINGRNLTNIGVFRQYIQAYLKNNPNVNQDMICMVRQLAPTDKGVPLEIYCFSASKVWIEYESIMADIFDHIMAAAALFDLEIFENPTGQDLKYIGKYPT